MRYNQTMSLDYGAPFGFFFKDKAWFRKFAIASLLTCTIIGITPVLGWTIEITRRVIRGEEDLLPDWKEIRPLWKSGFKYWLLNIVWLLPVILSILLMYIPFFFENSLSAEILLAAVLGVMCCVFIFIFIYSLAFMFLTPAAMGILAATGSLGKAINPLNGWKVARRMLGTHLLVFIIVWFGLFTVISVLAPLTLLLGLPPMLVYAGMVTAHYAGQLYSSYTECSPFLT